jgi:hypothetical protein
VDLPVGRVCHGEERRRAALESHVKSWLRWKRILSLSPDGQSPEPNHLITVRYRYISVINGSKPHPRISFDRLKSARRNGGENAGPSRVTTRWIHNKAMCAASFLMCRVDFGRNAEARCGG